MIKLILLDYLVMYAEDPNDGAKCFYATYDFSYLASIDLKIIALITVASPFSLC